MFLIDHVSQYSECLLPISLKFLELKAQSIWWLMVSRGAYVKASLLGFKASGGAKWVMTSAVHGGKAGPAGVMGAC